MGKLRYIFNIIIVSLLVSCSNNVNDNSTKNSTTTNSSEKTSEGISNINIISGSLLNNNEQLVKWNGRYEFKVGDRVKPTMMYLYHTATGFTVDFYGTSLEVEFYHYYNESKNYDIYYDVAIDDETLPNPLNRRFCLSKENIYQKVTLAAGLEEGHHTVTCLKMSETFDGYTAIKSLKTEGNFYYRKGLDEDKLKFMFVCASSGSGHGSLAYTLNSSTKPRTTANSSSLHSFMHLTARRFDSDFQFVSTSGWGIRYPESKQISEVLDYSGITISNNIEGSKSTALWDYNNFIPDIIMFHIGGNDTKQSNFDLIKYQTKAVEMIEKLHLYYPFAKMVFIHTSTKSGSYAMSAFKEAGIIRKNYLIEAIIPKIGEGETGKNTYGANDHPSFKTHLDSGKILTETISNKWGYTPTVEDIKFEQFENILDR